jgi:ribonuclease HI
MDPTDRKIVRLYTDGGSRGNPGPSAIGVVIFSSGDVELFRHSEGIGDATNNVAEYQALIKGLQVAAQYTRHQIECRSDSKLLVNQVIGAWRVKKYHLRKYHAQVIEAMQQFKTFTIKWVPRRHPRICLADSLVNQRLDKLELADLKWRLGVPEDARTLHESR